MEQRRLEQLRQLDDFNKRIKFEESESKRKIQMEYEHPVEIAHESKEIHAHCSFALSIY